MRFNSASSRQSSVISGWLRIGLLLIPASGGGVAFAEPELVDRIVAIIDYEVIALSEAEQAMRLLELRGADETSLRVTVERMIEAKLIGREVARFTDEPIPDEAVQDAIERVRAGFATEETFQEALRARGLTPYTLAGELRRQLMVERYLERRFRALTYVTDEEIEAYYHAEVEPLLPAEREPTLAELDQIRRLLEEQKFNERVERWIEGLKTRARIRRYVW